MDGWLSKQRIIAPAGFNRWLVPPCALAIHLCIGQAYAFSVFKLPLTRVYGITQSAPGDWTQPQLFWIFTLAIVFLGLSAAAWGRWLERVGPRVSGLAAALCWATGFYVAALGVRWHALWMVYIGYGVIGGCGLGLGYITPVSTLIKWFPDRRGMATGMAIMGFGGGAMIASPLSQILMDHFKSATAVGVVPTFVTLGTIYGLAMTCGALGFRLPDANWRPERWAGSRGATPIASGHVHVNRVLATPQFYLLWGVLFLNVTAGIGILEQASPMIQEVFHGVVTPAAAAGFVGLLSLFNILGRFGWSSLSDYLGRKRTYTIFFLAGAVLYFAIPVTGTIGSVPLFVAVTCAILTMYGGGFATIPAYLADIFGTQFVGAIHGRLLTAWSLAGVAGPALVNYIRAHQIAIGLEPAHSYDFTMRLMAVLLLAGLACNLAVRPVDARHVMSDAELAAARGGR